MTMELPQMESSALAEMIRDFMLEFRDDDSKFHYVDQIDHMMSKNQKFIIIDYNNLVSYRDLVERFDLSADEVLAAFSRAIYEILKERFPEYAEKIKDDIRARIVNYPSYRSLRQINAEVIHKMISISGMVVRASEVNPLARELIYKCPDKHITQIFLQKGLRTKVPVKCVDPKCTHRELELEPESSKFVDFQILRLQELPEDLPPGQLPHYIDVAIKQDLVDNARPGDRVMLTGLVRIEQESISGATRANSGLYRLRVDGNNVEFLGGRDKRSRKTEREQISPEDEKVIKSMSSHPDIYQKLIGSFAPHIKGHERIKEAILLLIVGSTQKQLEDGAKVRGDINVFLVGDPGTAKSEMLKFCARIAPRGLYTSGRGSTAAGLTAAVLPDKSSGIMMLEAGAVVLGDQGLVCIDEFDKMKPEDRSALHEVMEQQSASIAKGGIVATLNARTSILAAANPMYGKYDPFKNITENINLPVPLLTRFDLIFVVRDRRDPDTDREIANHVINIHTPIDTGSRSAIDVDIFTKYLSYAKRIDPVLTEEAKDRILEYYMKMRNTEDENMITVTPRQLEGLVRMTIARARLLLKSKADAEDAQMTISLMQHMLEEVGVDVNTGKVDLGVLQGKPQSGVSKMRLFMDIVRGLEGSPKSPVEEKKLLEELTKSGKFTDSDATDYIRKMQQDGTIYESRPGHYNTV